MMKRTISAIIMLIIVVPLLLLGGTPYNIGIYLVSLVAMKEFIDIKNSKKEVPIFIKVISYIFLSLIILTNINNDGAVFSIDYPYIAGIFLAYLIPTVLYHNRETYSINDAFYFIGGIFFLSTAMLLLISIRSIRLATMLYLILISTMTDTFAYLTGMLIGKHKLLVEISPKKTIEGTIGGTFFGTFIAVVFYYNVISQTVSLPMLIVATVFLSIMGQFGDLVMSAIKRYYGKKDFSNLIPGHGGILDRFDSILFVLLSYVFFMKFL